MAITALVQVPARLLCVSITRYGPLLSFGCVEAQKRETLG